MATALTNWRIDRAGPDAVIAAGIQTGNEASFANAKKWATQIFGTLHVPAFKVTPDGAAPSGLEIREPAGDAEWDEAAAGGATFEGGWNLRTPRTGAALRERAARTFSGERPQRYFVAVDGEGVVGGFELFEGAKLEELVFEHLPAALRAINLVMRVLPRDGIARANSVAGFWYADGREDVAHALWAFARTAAAESGNAIGMQFDPRGPLHSLLRVRPWTPKGQLSLAVRSPVPLSEERLLAGL